MFSIPSVSKILVVVGIVLIVLYGFKAIGRIDRERKAAAKAGSKRKPDQPATHPKERPTVEDLTECDNCHAFVPAAKTCGQCGARL
jgi:hypothetical protein